MRFKKVLYLLLILCLLLRTNFAFAAAIELFSTPLYSEIVSYWREENGNDTANLRNLTDINSPTYQAGQFNNGVLFDGSSNYQITSTLFTGSTGTIHLWFKSNDVNQATWFSQSKASDANYIRVGGCVVTGCTDIGADISVAGTQVLTFGTNVTGWNDNTWHMVDFTVSSTGNLFYIDGVVTTSITYANGNAATSKWFADLVGADSLTIGVRKYNGIVADYFNGMVDDVAVFSRALTPTEISNLYTGNFPSTAIPAQRLLNFEDNF